MTKISASTLPAKDDLAKYISKLDRSRVDTIHCDVMDGKFVDNKVFSPDKIDIIRDVTKKKIDVHLMVSDIDKELQKYIEKDINYITVHYESFENENELIKVISLIKLYGIKAGVSIKPSTPVLKLEKAASFLDLVLIMSVEPGKGGQEFLPDTLEKINDLVKLRKRKKNKFIIQVDGGINKSNIGKIRKSGADMVVIGTALHQARNIKKEIKLLKKI